MRRYKASNAEKPGIHVRILETLHARINANALSAIIKVITIAVRTNAKANRMAVRKLAILNINLNAFHSVQNKS
jgi:hypothetical protein